METVMYLIRSYLSPEFEALREHSEAKIIHVLCTWSASGTVSVGV